MTEKLYEQDPFLVKFEASVVSCVKGKKGFDIILDRTAFYPEGGGQPYDTGRLEPAGGERKVKGRYVSQRIPFAYDYYSRDDDVATTNNHGTHVTALAAGYVRDRMGRVDLPGGGPGGPDPQHEDIPQRLRRRYG